MVLEPPELEAMWKERLIHDHDVAPVHPDRAVVPSAHAHDGKVTRSRATVRIRSHTAVERRLDAHSRRRVR
jgi:hypothetical protein